LRKRTGRGYAQADTRPCDCYGHEPTSVSERSGVMRRRGRCVSEWPGVMRVADTGPCQRTDNCAVNECAGTMRTCVYAESCGRCRRGSCSSSSVRSNTRSSTPNRSCAPARPRTTSTGYRGPPVPPFVGAYVGRSAPEACCARRPYVHRLSALKLGDARSY